MQVLKADTEVKVRVGPFVDVGDGFTPETAVALGTADEAELLKHNGAATVDISANTWAAIAGCDGWYDLTLTAGNLDTEGLLTVVVQDDSVCLPVFVHFMVVNANVYDSLYGTAAADYLQVDTIQVSGTSQTANDNGADINAILVDTGTTLQGELDAIEAAVITNAAGADIAADIIAVKAETAAILDDTDLIDDGTSGLAKIAQDVAAILVDTGTTLPASLALRYALDTTVATSNTTTSFTLTAGKASNDAYNGMFITVVDADDDNVETRRIQDWTSGLVVTVERAFSFTPAVGDVVRIPETAYGVMAQSAGANAITYTVIDGDTNPIEGVTVWITTDISGAQVIWNGVTDSNGVAKEAVGSSKPYLDAGTYYFWCQKSGYSFSNPDTETFS